MNKSQNTISCALLIAMAMSLSVSTGCKMGALPKLPVSLPKMPDMAMWKKDSFRLSRSKSDSVAPPSRTFDPKPSHFAALDAEKNSASNQMAANASRPIRKPYDVEDDAPAGNESFGFPKNSDSLMGNNNSDFSMPDANEFRQAMNSTRERVEDFSAATQQAASQTIDRSKEFVANTRNNSSGGGGNFSGGGGDFVPKNNNQDFLNQSAQVARDVTQRQSSPSGWQSNQFVGQNNSAKNAAGLANQMAQNFNASAQNAMNNARQGMAELGEQAIDRTNQGFQAAQQAASNFGNNARNAIDATNQNLANAAGQFERSWQNSVDQAKQAANSIRNSNGLQGSGTRTNPLNVQNDFQPGGAQLQPAQGMANNNQLQPANQSQRSIEVTPQVEFGNQSRSANVNGQFASTNGGAFQAPSANTGPAQSNGGQAFTPNAQQPQQSNGGSRYPSTDYNPYIYGDNEKVSQVTPIAEPGRQNSAAGQPAAHSASLPSELLRGNSNYAPGSIKQLSPIK